MRRVRIAVAALLAVGGLAVARPVEAAGSWRAWQVCNGSTQFGAWVGPGGTSYTGYCYGSLGSHGCTGGPSPCTIVLWQYDGHGYRTAIVAPSG